MPQKKKLPKWQFLRRAPVLVHAIDDAARKFYEHFNFDPSPIDPFQLMLLLKDLRKALK